MMRGWLVGSATLIVLGAGCQSEEKAPETTPSERRGYGETVGLPGPPDTTETPRASDPATRAIEERLYRSDGGRVLLKALRRQGGWEAWRSAGVLRASSSVPSKAAVAPSSSDVVMGTSRTSWSEFFADRKVVALGAPFVLVGAEWTFEHLGVEVDLATGDSLDKVHIFHKGAANDDWLIASVSRRRGIVVRLLFPERDKQEAAAHGGFRRVDLSGHREVGGLLLPTIWTTYGLESRFSRADLTQPLGVVEAQIEVGPAAAPAQATAQSQ